jgi:hypothetical protein
MDATSTGTGTNCTAAARETEMRAAVGPPTIQHRNNRDVITAVPISAEPPQGQIDREHGKSVRARGPETLRFQFRYPFPRPGLPECKICVRPFGVALHEGVETLPPHQHAGNALGWNNRFPTYTDLTPPRHLVASASISLGRPIAMPCRIESLTLAVSQQKCVAVS